MRKEVRLVSIVCLVLLVALGLYFLQHTGKVIETLEDCVHTVSEGNSIQDAIDAASAGDVICVGAGTFVERVFIDDSSK